MVDVLDLLNDMKKYCNNTNCLWCGIREICDCISKTETISKYVDRRIGEVESKE